MNVIYFLLLLAGAVCFAIEAVEPGRVLAGKPRLLALGLLFWILVPLIEYGRAL